MRVGTRYSVLIWVQCPSLVLNCANVGARRHAVESVPANNLFCLALQDVVAHVSISFLILIMCCLGHLFEYPFILLCLKWNSRTCKSYLILLHRLIQFSIVCAFACRCAGLEYLQVFFILNQLTKLIFAFLICGYVSF